MRPSPWRALPTSRSRGRCSAPSATTDSSLGMGTPTSVSTSGTRSALGSQLSLSLSLSGKFLSDRLCQKCPEFRSDVDARGSVDESMAPARDPHLLRRKSAAAKKRQSPDSFAQREDFRRADSQRRFAPDFGELQGDPPPTHCGRPKELTRPQWYRECTLARPIFKKSPCLHPCSHSYVFDPSSPNLKNHKSTALKHPFLQKLYIDQHHCCLYVWWGNTPFSIKQRVILNIVTMFSVVVTPSVLFSNGVSCFSAKTNLGPPLILGL